MKRIIYHFFILITFATGTLNGQEGLVAHWSFDELVGDKFHDLSANMNHGTSYGGKLVDGIKGKAISFDGISDYIRIPEDGEPPPDIFSELGKGSISFWFKADNIPTRYGIAPLFYYGAEEKCDFFDAANKGFIIELGHSPIFTGSRELFFTAWKNGCTYPSFCFDSNFPISTKDWHHVVIVVGEDYNTGYLNGEEMSNRYYNFGNAGYSQFFEDALAHEKMWFGKGHWDSTTQYFDGAMDELKIFNRPLSSSEVLMLYRDTDQITSLQEEFDDKKVKIFPSPANDILSYQVEDTVHPLADIRVIDMKGNIALHFSDPLVRGKIHTASLSPGTYIVGFRGKKLSHFEKIVVR